MASGNIVSITGNLCGDPQHKTFGETNELATFQIAWNENRKNQQTGAWETFPHYFEIECWAGAAKMAMKFRKGDLATVTGRLRWRQWTGTQDNVQRERVSVVADGILGEPMFLPQGTIGAQLPPKQRDNRGRASSPADDSIPFPTPAEKQGVPLGQAMQQAGVQHPGAASPMPTAPVDDDIPW